MAAVIAVLAAAALAAAQPTPAPVPCVSPETEAECRAAVAAAGLSEGYNTMPFAWSYGSGLGCHTYLSGAFVNSGFWSTSGDPTGEPSDSNRVRVCAASTAPTPRPLFTSSPTALPTGLPTALPTAAPTALPTAAPTALPTAAPTASPTAVPTALPTTLPTGLPTAPPTSVPTALPTSVPTAQPTVSARPTPRPHWVWCASNTFTEHVIKSSATGATCVLAADVDRDGAVDVLFSASATDTVAVLFNDGSQTFTETVISSSADDAWYAEVGDVDGDADVDVLSAARTGDELVWWENDGTSTTFTKRLIATPACAPRPLPFCSRGRGESKKKSVTSTPSPRRVLLLGRSHVRLCSRRRRRRRPRRGFYVVQRRYARVVRVRFSEYRTPSRDRPRSLRPALRGYEVHGVFVERRRGILQRG